MACLRRPGATSRGKGRWCCVLLGVRTTATFLGSKTEISISESRRGLGSFVPTLRMSESSIVSARDRGAQCWQPQASALLITGR